MIKPISAHKFSVSNKNILFRSGKNLRKIFLAIGVMGTLSAITTNCNKEDDKYIKKSKGEDKILNIVIDSTKQNVYEYNMKI